MIFTAWLSTLRGTAGSARPVLHGPGLALQGRQSFFREKDFASVQKQKTPSNSFDGAFCQLSLYN
jgi:hypothetical protein